MTRATPDELAAHIVAIANFMDGSQYARYSVLALHYNLGRVQGLYADWLRASGLSEAPDKSLEELHSERALLAKQREAAAALARERAQPLRYLRRRLDWPLQLAEPGGTILVRMGERLHGASAGLQDVDGFFDFLALIDKRAKFLWADPLHGPSGSTYLDPLIRIWHRRGQWLRDAAEWRPKRRNRERQFASLLRHLLAEYDVPAFMDTVWMRNDSGSAKLRNAWVDVARGKNIRRSPALPMPLSKRAAHILLLAPEELTFELAVKWAHLQPFSLSARHVAALLGSRWSRDFDNVAFWDSVLRFLAANPFFAPDQVGPLVDYIFAQKFEGPVLLVEGDDMLRDDPPHPGFTMRGRNAQALLDQVEDWHRALGRRDRRKGSRAMDEVYETSGWKTLRSVEKVDDDTKRHWYFEEVLSQRELYEEGRAMRHCIYSYHGRIKARSCSVWSLRHRTQGGPGDGRTKRALTVEVSPTGTIYEARGFANAYPSGRARNLLQQWASENRMVISEFTLG